MAKKYKLKNTNLYHNGNFVKIGSVIELNDKDATKLADVLVEVKEKSASPDNSKTATKTVKTKTDTTKNKEENSSSANVTTEEGGNQ